MKRSAAAILGILYATSATTSEAMLPHSFLLPKAVPDAVGSYHLQFTPFMETRDGISQADLGAHASFGMFQWGGVHLRTLGLKTTSNIEVIGMVNLHRQGDRGISLLAIAAIPTKSKPGDEHGHGPQYQLGVAARPLASHDFSVDMNLHYDFTAGHLIPELGCVVKAAEGLYATLDGTASFGTGATAELLAGAKVATASIGTLGIGYRFPVTRSRSFDRQVLLQLEIGKH